MVAVDQLSNQIVYKVWPMPVEAALQNNQPITLAVGTNVWFSTNVGNGFLEFDVTSGPYSGKRVRIHGASLNNRLTKSL